MRLIDADALREEYDPNMGEMLVDMCRELDSQPTVDAVPVVRCKDCMHCMFGFCTSRNAMPTDPNDFCSHGERKNND